MIAVVLALYGAGPGDLVESSCPLCPFVSSSRTHPANYMGFRRPPGRRTSSPTATTFNLNMLSRSNRLLLAGAFALAALAAPAGALDSCVMRLPTIGNDTDPGYIHAGPRLLSAGDSDSYTYIVNSGSDNVEFWVQSGPPAPGDGIGYFRWLDVVLSAPNVTNYEAALAQAPSGCAQSWPRFWFSSWPGIPSMTVSNHPTFLNNSATGPDATCYFNHKWTMAWEVFRDADHLNCGFTISANESALTNGTYRTYKGRIHVEWEDNDSALPVSTTEGLPRGNMSTWYDVIIQVQSEVNQTTAATSSTEDM
ncbi:hypothetical protein DFJ74DRAFT_5425 [Hyaloraphidium curvatum]|nr:hypothetical protein DFJ74DRAFT_5425 [Hyaloraphidium curvatum]